MKYAKCHPERPSASHGPIDLCRECYNVIKRERYSTSKPRGLDIYLQSSYGISLLDYERLVRDQDNKCAICGQEDNLGWLSVDHNHETGEVRGLLCRACNAAIGALKDDPDLVRKALEYLER